MEPTLATTVAQETNTGGSIWLTVGYMAIFLVIMYLLIFLPQKKRDKKAKAMLSALEVGNSVTTIGGITGTIVNIKDDEVTIETSIEKTKINFKKSAIGQVKPVEKA
ncbi:MAG: preprotein translocase subunit YajC [Eubacteriales bacterium]|nr:preprotein translocase subunit YajC [Eubacteriales bacterium]